jgi:ADP-heptose:LPS heptosyltransferase
MSNTLVFRSGLIGDHLVAAPALKVLSENKYKLIYISFVEKKNQITPEEILKNFSLIDSFYIIRLYNFLFIIDLIKLIFFLIFNKCHEVYHLQTAEFNYKLKLFFFRLFGIKKFYFIVESHQKKMSDVLLNFVSKNLEISNLNPKPFKVKSSHNKALLLKLNNKFKFNNNKNKYAAIAINSNMKSKIWHVDNYIYISKKLASEGIIPCFYGGKNDYDYISKAINKIGTGLNFAGSLSVFESLISMDLMQFYIGNDTGVMHMAAIRNIKCFAIFSSIDFKNKWYPFGNHHVIFRTEIDCQICLLKECVKKQNLCLKQIKKENVYSEIKKHLLIQ